MRPGNALQIIMGAKIYYLINTSTNNTNNSRSTNMYLYRHMQNNAQVRKILVEN